MIFPNDNNINNNKRIIRDNIISSIFKKIRQTYNFLLFLTFIQPYILMAENTWSTLKPLDKFKNFCLTLENHRNLSNSRKKDHSNRTISQNKWKMFAVYNLNNVYKASNVLHNSLSMYTILYLTLIASAQYRTYSSKKYKVNMAPVWIFWIFGLKNYFPTHNNWFIHINNNK